MAFFGGGGASVDLASPPAIGNTTPNTGAFTTLSFAPANNTTGFSNTGNSLTGSNAQSLVSLAQTWNTTGTPTAIILNVTDTASNALSLFMDLQVGGASKFKVRKNGDVTITGGFSCTQNSTLDGIITRQAALYGGGDATGTLILQNSNFNNFNMLKIGGTSSSFPALKRSSAILQVRLADDSAYTTLDAQIRLQGTAPATAGATGTAGDIRYDADYIYICTATNTWKRVAIATW